MQGSLRKRSPAGGWEYIIDIGMAHAQRCQSCGKRFWVERRPKERCPQCAGKLSEADERRRQTKGGFRTRKDCQVAMTKAVAAVAAASFVPATHVTLREFLLTEWLPTIRGSLRETTYESYKGLCSDHIIPRLGCLKLQQLTASEINGLYAHLLQAGRVRGSGGLSASSVRRVHAALHRALRDAVRWGRLTVNPAAAVDPPKVSAEHEERTVWSAAQLAAFLESVRDDRLTALWRLLALTGMRRGEALGLEWGDLDMEASRLSICRALVPVNGVAHLCEPKTRQGRRTLALDRETLATLQAHAARQAAERSQAGAAWQSSDSVFVRPNGAQLEPYAVSKAFRNHLQAACLPAIRLHDLRHTYASLALASGINPRIVSGRLGHSTVAFTLDVYAHVLPQQDEAAAAAIAALLT
ncbi:MAG: tyrosine-type recombinase/integrase [Thermoleophilia bacterium]